MPSAFRNPKTLPEWIEMDYHQRPRRLRRWRGVLVWWTLLICLTVVATAALLPEAKPLYQSQPVSPAHAMFNNDCATCHEGRFLTAQRLISPSRAIRSVNDHACSSCHAGPKHNDFLIEPRQCATCHREHQGRALLAKVPDSHCTSCHSDLQGHHSHPQACQFRNVTGFPQGHPEFSPRTDPGQLAFNHKAHLNLKPLQDCNSCHQLDTAGEYLLPIQYEKHCADCHPLSVRVVGAFPDAKLRKNVERFNAIPAPHEKPEIVRAILRDRYLQFVQDNSILPRKPENNRAIPGPVRPRMAGEEEWVWAKRQLSEVEQLLFVRKQLPGAERAVFLRPAGCRNCHVSLEADALLQDPTALPKHKPTNLPQRWFLHSRFDHKSHRMMDCNGCHDAQHSTQTKDVLMPKLENCAQCHNPKVGATWDCVTCHTYHTK